jgi:hypothetical protein
MELSRQVITVIGAARELAKKGYPWTQARFGGRRSRVSWVAAAKEEPVKLARGLLRLVSAAVGC